MQYILFDNKKYKECKEIRKYTNDDLLMEFFNIVKPDQFKDNMHIYIKREPNTKGFSSSPIEKKPNPEWWVIRLRERLGHPDANDSYCIKYKQSFNDICGQYKDLSKKTFYDTNTKT